MGGALAESDNVRLDGVMGKIIYVEGRRDSLGRDRGSLLYVYDHTCGADTFARVESRCPAQRADSMDGLVVVTNVCESDVTTAEVVVTSRLHQVEPGPLHPLPSAARAVDGANLARRLARACLQGTPSLRQAGGHHGALAADHHIRWQHLVEFSRTGAGLALNLVGIWQEVAQVELRKYTPEANLELVEEATCRVARVLQAV